MTKNRFYDTYAVLEILEGNPNYSEYLSCEGVISIFNLAETAFALNRKKHQNKEKIVQSLADCVVDTTTADLHEAARIKSLNKQLSMTDAIGYCISIRLGIPFVTGDKGFIGMPNVEFVK